MKENFLDAADKILSFKTHRDAHVRKMVITLIPTLAVYDTQSFSEHHLHKAMAHLLTQLEKPAERSVGKCLVHIGSYVLTAQFSSIHCNRARRHCCNE